VRFSYTHHMPYTDIKAAGQDWPVPNKQFDPDKGAQMMRTYIDDKIYAEEVGFDWIACNEHHMSPYGLMPNPNLIGSILAHNTKRSGILMSGNIVPIANPIRVAEEYAMIDAISGGRLIAGFMRGIPHEYVAYNCPPDESYGRMFEAVELIRKAWSEPEPFGWEGEFYQFRAVSIWPKPVQKEVPLLMSVSSEMSSRLAAKHRAIAGVLGISSLDDAKKIMARYHEDAKSFGWTPTPQDFMVGMNCSIAPTYEEAKAILEKGQEYFFGVLGGGIRTAQKLVVAKTRYYHDKATADKQINRFVNNRGAGRMESSFEEKVEAGTILCGTPDMVVKQIERLHKELGHGRMGLSVKVGNVTDAHVTRTLNYLKDVVFPATRHLGEGSQKAAE